LLKAGSDVNVKDNSGTTALLLAIEKIEKVKDAFSLITRQRGELVTGSTVNIGDDSAASAAYQTAYQDLLCATDIALELVRRGASLEELNQEQRQDLLSAAPVSI
jgi:ankyrin repeat protein